MLQGAQGLESPTLGFNLAPISDWGTQHPFIDLVKSSRAWIGQGDNFSYIPPEDVSQILQVDEFGWPESIPDSLNSVSLFWNWDGGQDSSHFDPDYRAGRYVLKYEGEGTIDIPNAEIVQQSEGEIVFEINGEDNLEIRISETDPSGNGDYLNSISVVREDFQELHDIGALFNPDWVEIIEDSSQLRFMEWMKINELPEANWAERPNVDDVSFAGPGGPPLEIMVQLANEVGADPWFSIPHGASDEYVESFATYVRDNLDPSLKAHFEYGNEAWNGAFEATGDLKHLAELDWDEQNVDTNLAFLSYHAKLATNMALMVDEVFEGLDERVVTVISTQTDNPFITELLLSAPKWLEHEPESYVDPSSVFDAVGVTGYFGAGLLADSGERQALLNALNDPDVDITEYLQTKLLESGPQFGLPDLENALQEQSDLIDQLGMKLLMYEGGQHIHHFFGLPISEADVSALQAPLEEFVRSEEMADLYAELWDIWAEVGDGPFNHFNDVGDPGIYGSWALYSHLMDSNPRADTLSDLNESSEQWWSSEERDPDAFFHGVTILGTDDAETISASERDDYLVGAGGDDRFLLGGGLDHLHGGDGDDVVFLPGSAADYSHHFEGDVLVIESNDYSARLLNVERIGFINEDASETIHLLQDFLHIADGTGGDGDDGGDNADDDDSGTGAGDDSGGTGADDHDGGTGDDDGGDNADDDDSGTGGGDDTGGTGADDHDGGTGDNAGGNDADDEGGGISEEDHCDANPSALSSSDDRNGFWHWLLTLLGCRSNDSSSQSTNTVANDGDENCEHLHGEHAASAWVEAVAAIQLPPDNVTDALGGEDEDEYDDIGYF